MHFSPQYGHGAWNAVCVGRNTTAQPHHDLANTPGSLNLTLSLGDFEGGQLWVEDPAGKTPVCMPDGVLLDGCIHVTHNARLLFPCETAYHMPDVAADVLAGLGFPPGPPPKSTPSLKRKLPAVQFPCLQANEVALSAMRAQADKLLAPDPALVPVPADPRGSPVVGFSPGPNASRSPAIAELQGTAPVAPTSLVPFGSRSETPCQQVTCDRPLVIELCCGTALLSSVAQEAGYAVLPVDWGHNKRKPYVRALQMDLRQPSTWEFIRHVCKSRPIAWIHAAPPCGTASRAREIGKGPRPLRSMAHVRGLPDLDPVCQERVASAKMIYGETASLCLACS